MESFTTLTGIAAPLLEDNVDTDVIFPARFLLITARDGLGRYAFHDRRDVPGFTLAEPRFAGASILIAGSNFGCGSSREQAVWALLDNGIRCIIAPSFAEIFCGNCLRNGVLPITLPADVVAGLAADAIAGRRFTVDLEATTIDVEGKVLDFAIPEAQRLPLLNGWDETDVILNGFGDRVAAFENAQRAAQPWLWKPA